MTGSPSLLVTTTAGNFFAGVLLALFRNLQGPLAEHLGTTEGRFHRLRTAFAALLVPLMLVSGLLLDKWGPQPLLLGGPLLAALGVMALEPSRGERSALVGVLLTAVGAAAVAVSSLVLLPRAFYPNNATASAMLGCVFLALGALLTPALMSSLTRAVGFRRGLLVLALFCLTPAVCGMNVPAKDFGAPPAAGDSWAALHNVGLWAAMGVMLFYQPLEEALGRVTAGSLKELHVSERGTLLWVGLFWLTFVGTRFVTGLVIRPGAEGWVAFLGVVLAAVMFGNLMGNDRPAGRGIGFAFTAICLAPVFPAVLGLVLCSFPSAPGAACGTLLAGASLGALVLPSLLHPASERHSARVAMRLALGFTLVLILVSLLLALVPPGR
jgi:hypothetical protein